MSVSWMADDLMEQATTPDAEATYADLAPEATPYVESQRLGAVSESKFVKRGRETVCAPDLPIMRTVDDTWACIDSPYFPDRAVVKAASFFVATSLAQRIANGKHDEDMLPHIAYSSSPPHFGARRFFQELVPRARRLQDQICSSVSGVCRRATAMEVDEETRLFLLARRVVVDISDADFPAHANESFQQPPIFQAELRGDADEDSVDDDEGDAAMQSPGASYMLPNTTYQRHEEAGSHFLAALAKGISESLWGEFPIMLVSCQQKRSFLRMARRIFEGYGETTLSLHALLHKVLSRYADSVFFEFVLSDEPETQQEQMGIMNAFGRSSHIYMACTTLTPMHAEITLKNSKLKDIVVWPFSRDQVRAFVDDIWNRSGDLLHMSKDQKIAISRKVIDGIEPLSDFVYSLTGGVEPFLRVWLYRLRTLVNCLRTVDTAKVGVHHDPSHAEKVTIQLYHQLCAASKLNDVGECMDHGMDNWRSEVVIDLPFTHVMTQSYLRTHIAAGVHPVTKKPVLWPLSQPNVVGLGRPFIHDDLEAIVPSPYEAASTNNFAPKVIMAADTVCHAVPLSLASIPNKFQDPGFIRQRTLVRSQSLADTLDSPAFCSPQRPGTMGRQYRRAKSLPCIHIDTTLFNFGNIVQNSIVNIALQATLLTLWRRPPVTYNTTLGAFAITGFVHLYVRVNAARRHPIWCRTKKCFELEQAPDDVSALATERLLFHMALESGAIPTFDTAFGENASMSLRDEPTMYAIPGCVDIGRSLAAQFTEATSCLPPSTYLGNRSDCRLLLPSVMTLRILLLLDDAKKSATAVTFNDIFPLEKLLRCHKLSISKRDVHFTVLPMVCERKLVRASLIVKKPVGEDIIMRPSGANKQASGENMSYSATLQTSRDTVKHGASMQPRTKMTPKGSGPDYLSSLATRISLVRSRAAHLTVTPIMLLHEALQWLTTLEAPSAVVVPHNRRSQSFADPLIPVFVDVVFKWPQKATTANVRNECAYVFMLFIRTESLHPLSLWTADFQRVIADAEVELDYYIVFCRVEDRGGPGPHGPRLLDDNPRVLVVNDVTWAKKWNVAALIDQIKSMEVPRELQCLKKMETMGREAAHLEEDKPFEQDLNANEMFMNLLLDALVDETS